jgi:hypothetical protein
MNKNTADAQDELITFMLAPMQKKLDKLKADNKKRQIEQVQYDADLKAGLCVAKYGVYYCPCKACEDNGRAYDIVENKQPDITAYDALIQDGFNDAEAKEQIEIFDDLGIFNDAALFCLKPTP